MAPPPAALGPRRVKTLLERLGYAVVEDDEYHWAFASRPHQAPILVPKKVAVIPAEVVADPGRKVGS